MKRSWIRFLTTVLLVFSFGAASMAAGWTEMNGDWYFLDEQGNPVFNMFRISEPYWYYVGPDGKMLRDTWILYDGDYYYVNKAGAMLSNCRTPDGYWVGEDGKWDGKESSSLAQENADNASNPFGQADAGNASSPSDAVDAADADNASSPAGQAEAGNASSLVGAADGGNASSPVDADNASSPAGQADGGNAINTNAVADTGGVQSGGDAMGPGSQAAEPSGEEYEFLTDAPFRAAAADEPRKAGSQLILVENIGDSPIVVYSAFSRNRSKLGWESNAYLKYSPYEVNPPYMIKANSASIQPGGRMYLEFCNLNDEKYIFGPGVSTYFVYEYKGEGYYAKISANDDRCVYVNLSEAHPDNTYFDIDTFRNNAWNDAVKTKFRLD